MWIGCVTVVAMAVQSNQQLAAQITGQLPTQYSSRNQDVSVVEHNTARLIDPREGSIGKERALIREVHDPELNLDLEPSESLIIRTNYPVTRTAVSHEDIVDVQAFGLQEIEVIGNNVGHATLTFWFEVAPGDVQVLRYSVNVDNRREKRIQRERRYKQLQSRLNEIFPDSQVFLFPIEDKVIVRGQARDAKEASDIMRMLGQSRSRGSRGGNGNRNANLDGFFDDDIADIEPYQFINMLQVPGEQQVMLKVRVAELVRSSTREQGADIQGMFDSFSLSHLISGGGNLSAILADGDVSFFLKAISSHGYGKILAEPTLVTISGKPAKFLAGGEFAVPTTVGVGGVGAASTTFRGFGTELEFTPTVLDKDLVRLEVSPSFSTLNNDASVGGIPGLNLRSVNTTVDLREGQWLAIAGLIQDEQSGQRTKLPLIGDLPTVGGLFGTQNTARYETELIVLVSPELVHPMEAADVPMMLPGMEVTDPTDRDFYFRRMVEGYQGHEYRSTVQPVLASQVAGIKQKERFDNIRPRTRQQIKIEQAYISGPSGFSK
jgi:pilus assembly protein CpaC